MKSKLAGLAVTLAILPFGVVQAHDDDFLRDPYLEAALRQLRETSPQLQASDMELASAILASQNETPARFGSH